jgi:hypothetical protein
MRQDVTSNLILSQRRTDNVMQYMISQRAGLAAPIQSHLTQRQRDARRTGAWSLRLPTPAVRYGCELNEGGDCGF